MLQIDNSPLPPEVLDILFMKQYLGNERVDLDIFI